MTWAVVLIVASLAFGGCGSAPPAQRPEDAPIAVDGPRRFDPWDDAARRGVDVRAVGQEPGWFVEIDHDAEMHLVWDYMEHELTRRSPSPRVVASRTVYESGGPDGPHVVVMMAERPCSDVMGGQPFPLEVTVVIDGRELRGCGRRLE